MSIYRLRSVTIKNRHEMTKPILFGSDDVALHNCCPHSFVSSPALAAASEASPIEL
jgi:hypothetical protein